MMRTCLTRRTVTGLGVLGTLLAAGCDVGEVNDPTQVQGSDIANVAGANMQRYQTLSSFYVAVSAGAKLGALWTDEFFVDLSPDAVTSGLIEGVADQRASERYEMVTQSPRPYQDWSQARFDASIAIPSLRAYMPDSLQGPFVGQMLAVRGFATLALAEQMCPGLPLHEVIDDQVVIGSPLTTDQIFARALADLDSAVALAADSAQILDFARIARGRALLGQGHFAEAAAAVADVATSYRFQGEYVLGTRTNDVFFPPYGNANQFSDWSIGDGEGGNGLDFVSAADPRVPTRVYGTGYHGTSLHATDIYTSGSSPIVIASGIEARLIEAEAALQAGDAPGWLAKLNDLRATAIAPVMAPLADPGSEAARVDLLFRERAFWLFATGHRLGDLRRLVGQYGRDPETVFPTGLDVNGRIYEAGTSIPFPAAKEQSFNPAVTGCTSR